MSLKSITGRVVLLIQEAARRGLEAAIQLYEREPARVIGYTAAAIGTVAARVFKVDLDTEQVLGFLLFVASLIEATRRKVSPARYPAAEDDELDDPTLENDEAAPAKANLVETHGDLR
jgi:hypothetical protein